MFYLFFNLYKCSIINEPFINVLKSTKTYPYEKTHPYEKVDRTFIKQLKSEDFKHP